MKNSTFLTADFETTNDAKDCRVWLACIYDIEKEKEYYFNDIKTFLEYFEKSKKNYKVYFNNLKFDGEFIIYYLLSNDFKYITNKSERQDKSFMALIGDNGIYYQIDIYFKIKGKKSIKVTFADALNIFNMSIEELAKTFGFEEKKGSIDYFKKRDINYIANDEEKSYIKNDCVILAKALKIAYELEINKITIGASALAIYKNSLRNFDKYFPQIDLLTDIQIRKSYRGGFVYLNNLYKGKKIKNVVSLDINSMYPFIMKNESLPFGEPLYFEGEYQKDICYPLFIQNFSCSFKIKKGKVPFIEFKDSFDYAPNKHVEDTKGEIMYLSLTSVELEIFFQNYEVDDIIYHNGYKFKRMQGLFNAYIDFWSDKKINAKKNGNSGKYYLSKKMLNSLYGKFGKNPQIKNKKPELRKDGSVKYVRSSKIETTPIYTALASFVTAYGRKKIIETANIIREYSLIKYNKDMYIYSDTDSLVTTLPVEDVKNLIDIDDFEIGKFKIENISKYAIFLKQKCYIKQNSNDELKKVVAGMPRKLLKYINIENFKSGFSILTSDKEKEHKLVPSHVKGGIILVEQDYIIN